MRHNKRTKRFIVFSKKKRIMVYKPLRKTRENYNTILGVPVLYRKGLLLFTIHFKTKYAISIINVSRYSHYVSYFFKVNIFVTLFKVKNVLKMALTSVNISCKCRIYSLS